MSLIASISVAVISFAISVWFTRRFSSPDSIVYILDHPNERSLHDRPIPRGGGLAILIAIIACSALTIIFYSAHDLAPIALAVLIVTIISFFDDHYSIPPLYRFLVHVAVAGIVVYGDFFFQKIEIPGVTWEWPYMAGALFSALFIVWMINLYNFMDGMDGFASGMAVFGFGTFAILGWTADHNLFMSISLIIASASAGFLVFNFPPASIFMGDIGSSTFGLLAAVLSLWGVKDHVFPFWVAMLVFSPFIMDATVTLLRRALRREKVWQAHKTHFYQKLVQAGWGHRKTLVLEYLIMFWCSAAALWGVYAPEKQQMAMLFSWVAFYFIFFLWVTRYAARRNRLATL